MSKELENINNESSMTKMTFVMDDGTTHSEITKYEAVEMETDKTYMLFGGEVYYAAGGANEYITSSKNLKKLTNLAEADCREGGEWWHIVEAGTMKTVAQSEKEPHT